MRYLIFSILILMASCSLFSQKEEYSPEIVFSAEDEKGTFQIFSMNDDGTNIKKLTNFGTDDGGVQPSWSPDGKKIIFSTTLNSTSNGLSLYIMDADGSNLRPMNDREGSDVPTPGNYAEWSPDGNKIVYQSCVACQVGTNIELFLYDFATDSVIQLTETDYPVTNTYPVWSPDGEQIAFVSDRDYTTEGGSDIYVFDIEQNLIKKITDSGNAGRPLWYKESIFFWSENNLYLIDLSSMVAQKIHVDIEINMGFRPLTFSETDKQILLHVFNYSNPREEETMQIFFLEDGLMSPIYKGKGINRADWFNPNFYKKNMR